MGNHEFDDKIAGLVPFIQSLKGPVVVSNIDASKEPSMQGLFNKSVVVERNGLKIGIIGVLLSTIGVRDYLSWFKPVYDVVILLKTQCYCFYMKISIRDIIFVNDLLKS